MTTILDILVTPTYSKKTLGINDISEYPDDPPIVEAPSIEISIPGFDSIILPFVPGELNVFNSASLGLSDVGIEDPIPDGIYVVRYSITPAESSYVEKTFLRVEKLQETFDTAFMKLDLANCNDLIKKQQKVTLDTINYFIQGAIASANNCSTTDAMKLYKKAYKLLHNFIQRGECCGITFPSNFY